MIPIEEAWDHVLAGCEPLPVVPVALADALGLVIAADVLAAEPVPPFENTAVDGFAVRAADTVGAPVELKVVATLAAGSASAVAVGAGEAIRIMTGAPMPPGADAVVMVEDTSVAERAGDEIVTVRAAASPGAHVRAAGEDVRAGQLVFEVGTEVSAGHLGVLASLGHTEVAVHRRPRVGVMSTGDELVEGSAPLAPGQIRDSNRLTLLALVAQSGCEPVDLGLARDDEAEITATIRRGVRSCDVLLSSGGVSMGDFDYVKTVLDDLGDMRWMQVAIKPAKPLAFGVVDGIPVLGLPGNPVSSMVSFELFARPALRRLMGHPRLHRPRVTAVADDGLARRPDGKTHFARVVLWWGDDGRYHVRSAGGQGSHQLTAMATANALAVLPDGDGAAPGAVVQVMALL